MSAGPLNVLIIEDNETDARMIALELRKSEFEMVTTRVESEAEFRVQLTADPDIILCDYNLPQFGALRALEVLHELRRDIPFVIVSGSIGEETAVQAMQHGASDYLLKDRLGRLGIAVKQALAQRKSRVAERQARHAEEATAERLKLALGVAKMGVWDWDLRTGDVYWSPECFEIARHTEFDGTLAGFQRLLMKDDANQLMQKMESAIQSGLPFELEFSVKCDQEIRWFSSTGRCEYDPDAAPKRVIGTVQDITERKVAANRIIQSEARLRETFDQMLEGCQIIDFDLRYVYLNANALRHGRNDLDDMIGKRMDEAYPGFEKTRTYAALCRCLQDRVPSQMESRFVFPDGSVGVFDLSLLPVPEGALILSYEITEKKLAEESQQKTDALLQAAQRVASIGVWDWDLADGIWWSEELYHIFGRDRASSMTSFEKYLELIPAETRKQISTAIRATLEEGASYRFEHRIFRPNGEERWVDVYGVLERNDNGKPIRLWGVCQDITARKKAEDELRTSERRFRDSEEKYRLALDAAELGTWRYDFATGDAWLDEVCRLQNGFGASPLRPAELLSMVRPEDASRLAAIAKSAREATDGDRGFAAEYRIEWHDGTYRWMMVRAKFRFAEGQDERVPQQINGITRDITRRKKAETAYYRQSLVLEQIAIGMPFSTVLYEIVDLVEEQLTGSICSIHLVDRDRRHLQFAAGPNLPDSYVQSLAQVSIAENAEYCGIAAYTGKAVTVADIAADPEWTDFSQAALENGLRSCWSIPILAASENDSISDRERVLGTFSLYRREPFIPGVEEELVLATAVHLARVAIERENSYRALRESEARYATISEITRCVTFAVRLKSDAAPTIEWCLPRFGLLSGYTEAEYVSQGLETLFHPDERDRVEEIVRQIVAGHPQREELRFLTKAGDTLTVLLHGQLLETGPAVDEFLIIGCLLDISEFKAVEMALRTSKERFKLALRGANDGLWDWNLKTNQVFLSPRWKSMLGFEDRELEDSLDTWLNLIHRDDRVAAEARARHFLDGDSDKYESEFRLRHKNGEYRDISSRGFLVRDESGRPVRMVGTHQDITERKQADEELRASRQRLEVLSRELITTREEELRHLARELHDEIGQVLTAMKMNLRGIQRSSDPVFATRLDENISMIDQATEQVRNIALNMRPPHLDDLGLAAALHWYLKRQAKIVGFDEHLSVTPAELQVPAELATVCFRITQEAVTNAIRHAKARRIQIELRKIDSLLQLTIRDDGVGFDLSAATKRAADGGSLGLISMRERASLAGGRIEIESASGQGTAIHASFLL